MTALAFELPAALEAQEPRESRGCGRDDVKLLVATRHDGAIAHRRFRDLPSVLAPGDLVVVNTSATLPAAVAATRSDGTRLRLHFSTPAPGRDESWWVVEAQEPGGARPLRGRSPADSRSLEGGGRVEIAAPFARGTRLWLARLDLGRPAEQYLQLHGRPIRYGYVAEEWPLEAYQNVYATEPGSAEMPSAGRPF